MVVRCGSLVWRCVTVARIPSTKARDLWVDRPRGAQWEPRGRRFGRVETVEGRPGRWLRGTREPFGVVDEDEMRIEKARKPWKGREEKRDEDET